MLAEGYKETEIGVIPEDWEVAQLDKVTKIIDSLHITPKFVDNGISMVRVSDIKLGKLNLEDTFKVTEETFITFTKNYTPKKNDIVLSRVGSYGVSSYVTTDEAFCMGQNTVVINPLINNKFVYYNLNSIKTFKQIEIASYGSGYKSLSLKNIKELIIPLPPLKEQEKIADILSTADEKIDAVEGQIQKAETLKKGLLQKLLSEGIGHSKFKDSELGKIPESWSVVKLDNLSKITMGQSPKSDTYNTNKIGMPLIQGNADCKNRKTIPRSYTTELTKECFIGDIIMTVRAPVGAISKSLHNACIGRGVCSIKPNEDNEYIYHCLVAYEDNWDKLSQGSTFTAVSGSDIKNLKFPLPPLEEQKQIADILSTADEKLEVLRAKKEKYETLKKGLLQKLLSGEVRV